MGKSPFLFRKREKKMRRRMSKKLWDAEDVAVYWGVHPETVRLKSRQGVLKAICEHPLIFRKADILKLPIPKWGRPRKSSHEGGEHHVEGRVCRDDRRYQRYLG